MEWEQQRSYAYPPRTLIVLWLALMYSLLLTSHCLLLPHIQNEWRKKIEGLFCGYRLYLVMVSTSPMFWGESSRRWQCDSDCTHQRVIPLLNSELEEPLGVLVRSEEANQGNWALLFLPWTLLTIAQTLSQRIPSQAKPSQTNIKQTNKQNLFSFKLLVSGIVSQKKKLTNSDAFREDDNAWGNDFSSLKIYLHPKFERVHGRYRSRWSFIDV